MEDLTTQDQLQAAPRRRRRSRHKSSKEAQQRRRRVKSLVGWLIFALVGAALVAGIAVVAGSSGN